MITPSEEEILPNFYKIWFNGIELTQYFRVKEVRGRGLVNIEVGLVEIPGKNGGYLRKKKRRPPRPISIEAVFMLDDEAVLRQTLEELSSILATDGIAELVFWDEPERVYLATYNGASEKGEWEGYHLAELNFICPDPDKFGSELEAGTTVTNNGSGEASPIIIASFTAAASEYKIAHSNGKFVRVIYNFIAGDLLEIDLTRRKVKINSIVNMIAYDWRSQPFTLLPGNNVLTVTPDAVATTTIKYRPRWV